MLEFHDLWVKLNNATSDFLLLYAEMNLLIWTMIGARELKPRILESGPLSRTNCE